MAENLNQYDEKCCSRCYDGRSSLDCTKYGRFYDWTLAKTLCPTGWHLPTQAEWQELFDFVEEDSKCTSCAGSKLKATSGWKITVSIWDIIDENGTDDYGFSALPGGRSNALGFQYLDERGYWWSITDDEGDPTYRAYFSSISNDGGYYTDIPYDKQQMLPVRCVKDF